MAAALSAASVNYGTGLVSIVIPTYNRYDLLLHCIRSCLAQTYRPIELIVVNDASTDPRYTDGTLETFPHTKVIHLPINQRQKYNTTAAQGMTRQEGIHLSSGEWIAFLDDDDFFLPHKLDRQLACLREHNGLFCSSNMLIVSHNSVSGEDLDIQIKRPYFRHNVPNTLLTLPVIERSNLINNSTVLIHRTVVDKTGPFRPEIYEDWNYWKRALCHTPCYYLHDHLVYYTIDDGHTKHYVYSEQSP